MMCLIFFPYETLAVWFRVGISEEFHDFVHEYMKNPEFVELMGKLGALGDGNQNQSKSCSILILHLQFCC